MGLFRKGFALFVALVMFSVTAQTAISASDLTESTSLSLREGMGAMAWNLTFLYDSPDYRLGSTDEMAAALTAGTSFDWGSEEDRMLAWHFREQAAESVRAVRLLGGYEGGFLESDMGPVAFFQHQGEFGMLLSGVGVGVSLNTVNSTELERTRRIVYEFIVPVIARVARPFEGTAVKWVGVSLAYGARDFTERGGWDPPEMSIVVVSVSDAMAFDRLGISDTELVRRAFVLTGTPITIRRVDLGR